MPETTLVLYAFMPGVTRRGQVGRLEVIENLSTNHTVHTVHTTLRVVIEKVRGNSLGFVVARCGRLANPNNLAHLPRPHLHPGVNSHSQ